MPPSALTPLTAAMNPAFCSSGVAMPNVLLASGPTIVVRPNATFTVSPLTPGALPAGHVAPDAAACGVVAAGPPDTAPGLLDRTGAPGVVVDGLAPGVVDT